MKRFLSLLLLALLVLTGCGDPKPKTDPAELARTVDRLVQTGKSVSAQKAFLEKLRYGELMDLREEGAHA